MEKSTFEIMRDYIREIMPDYIDPKTGECNLTLVEEDVLDHFGTTDQDAVSWQVWLVYDQSH